MTNAREMAAKILKGQVDTDIEFHRGIIIRAKMAWVIVGLAFLCVVVAIIVSQLAWAVIGFIICISNLVFMYVTGKRLVEHQCTLANVKTHLNERKNINDHI